jgi:hypothetical protein
VYSIVLVSCYFACQRLKLLSIHLLVLAVSIISLALHSHCLFMAEKIAVISRNAQSQIQWTFGHFLNLFLNIMAIMPFSVGMLYLIDGQQLDYNSSFYSLLQQICAVQRESEECL